MPKYRFICDKCDLEETKYCDASVEQKDCEQCGNNMTRQMPRINGQSIRETIDTGTGVTWHQDQKEKLQDRKEEYFWEKEVPRLVEKYSLETCLENKWLVYNERGELVIGKAPSKQ